MSGAEDLPWSTFTGRMREMERAVRAMADVTGTQFKLFTAVTQGMNEETGEFYCQDEVMCVACGVRRRQSLSEARAALAEKRLIEFEPGRPGKATVYLLPMSDNTLLDLLASLGGGKIEARLAAAVDRPRRNGVRKSGRGEGGVMNNRRPEKRTQDGAASAKTDTKNDHGVRFGVPSASAKTDTLHPQHTPQDSAADNQVTSSTHAREEVLAPVSEFGVQVPSHLTAEARLRGAEDINRYIARKAKAAGIGADEVDMALGDRLSRMALEIAIFPGDNLANFRKVDAVIASLLREASNAA